MLSRVFLIEIAQQYGLSDKEQEVFLEKFGTDKSDQAIAQELFISDGAFRDRMSRVYRKFSINGKGPVKSDLLFRFLTKEYQKSKPSGSPRADGSEDDLDELVQKVRSLQVSPDKIQQVNQALEREVLNLKEKLKEKRKTENPSRTEKIEFLAEDRKLAIQPIKQFFAGEPVKRDVFINICSQLKLEWHKTLDVDFLKLLVEVVPQVRSQHYAKIQRQWGTLRILDVARPIELNDLYVDVNILDEPPRLQRLELCDLPQVYNPKTDEFNRFGLGNVRQPRVPGLRTVENHRKLMVLGKPGAGKSTFLQHIAIQCNEGDFQADRVPIFIRLKTFAEDAKDIGNFSLLHYISQEFDTYEVAAQSVTEKLLKYGRGLILLDGLDEISEENSQEVVKQIESLCKDYDKNQFVITCRIAASEYRFPGFTDVEVADFNQEQIENFAKKWFVAVDRNSEEEGKVKAIHFIEKLNRPENQPIREIAITPILLTLTCLVFQAKAKFPSKRAKLYEEGLEILLRKWDEARGIKRDDIYRNLSLEHKIELLTQVAAITFEKNRYFFEQGEIHQCIADYLRTLPDAQTNLAALQRDSEAVMKAIEVQHGLLVERARRIYSFSHLTFQEYFTAKAFLTSFKPQDSDKSSIHLIKKSWREVFLLVVDMMGSAGDLLRLIKEQVDALLASDEKLQNFLDWVNQKSLSVKVSYKLAVVRDVYFVYGRDCNLTSRPEFYLVDHLDSKLNHNLDRIFDLNLARDRTWSGDLELDLTLGIALGSNDDIALLLKRRACELARSFPKLQQSLQQLREQAPKRWVEIMQWSRSERKQAWTKQLRAVMIEHRNIGHDWQFSEQQKEALEQYYYANKLLIECMNSGCEVSTEVRQEIEDTLLLPIAEIEKRRQQS